MKMENLLKCEQVLVNLYAKVEQRDSLPGLKIEVLEKTKRSDLNTARNKLKSVVSKLQKEPNETLPEIARASETEEVCVPGSKEPALFQRRPNKSSMSPTHPALNRTKVSPQMSKRNYTRVLQSPEPSQKDWPDEENSSDKPLLSRRSPKKSLRKRSPSYYRKERKKRSKSKSRNSLLKDFNITLNVPEDSLSSLNTKDISSRIINCSDNDVDITTLRELRTQILGELKDTVANDDISDIILKSYKNADDEGKASKEVEEGELSDSESEAIENIYGSLVVLDKSKPTSADSISADKQKARKIQICLVINSDKTSGVKDGKDEICGVDFSDFETFDIETNVKEKQLMALDKVTVTNEQNNDNEALETMLTNDYKNIIDTNNSQDAISKNTLEEDSARNQKTSDIPNNTNLNEKPPICADDECKNFHEKENIKLGSPKAPKPKPKENVSETKNEEHVSEIKVENYDGNIAVFPSNESNVINIDKKDVCHIKPEVDIPLLEPTKNVSEIDILQALKNEILSETSSVLNTDTVTPLLHQPKVTKVANALEIGSKKRISIESYKAKATTSSKSRSSGDSITKIVKDDVSRKQSLKLTEKECERFNFLSKLTLQDSSDEEDQSSLSVDDIYTDLAPKSPDHEDFADTGLKPPVIIPNDPIQKPVVGSEADVDMRKLLPQVKTRNLSPKPVPSPVIPEISKHLIFDHVNKNNEKPAHCIDPRIKKELKRETNQDSPKHCSVNIGETQIPFMNMGISSIAHTFSGDKAASTESSTPTRNSVIPPNSTLKMAPIPSNVSQSINSTPTVAINPIMTPSITANIGPNMTPSRALLSNPSMTPSRTPNIAAHINPCMTPSLQSFDNEDFSRHKHVYAPVFSFIDTRDNIEKPIESKRSSCDTSSSQSSLWEDRDLRNISKQNDIDHRESRNSKRDIDYREMNQLTQRDISYRDPRSHSGFRDTDFRDPRNNSMQRELGAFDQYSNSPRNDRFSFDNRDSSRIEIPTTPIHSFGRLDCPSTPTPSFGMLESPMTPVHSFGRIECPPTPSHTFGRVEPLFPSQNSFQRSEYKNSQCISRSQDPRLNRNCEYEDDRERPYYQDRKFHSNSYNKSNRQDSFRRYSREQSVNRNERHRNYDSIGRNYRDQTSQRETSVGRSFNRGFESDRFCRNRKSGRGYNYRNHNESISYEDIERPNRHRERSVGRSMVSQERSSSTMRERSNFSKENKLCVQQHAGHSFMIDTSINNSFQERNTTHKSSSSFDARRQRAASVGRSLCRDSSTVNKAPEMKPTICDRKKYDKFRRACSVGREIRDSRLDFEDTKADLKSFKFKSDIKWSKEIAKHNVDSTATELTKKYDSGHERNVSDKTTPKSKYSPRKNVRDPRMRREYPNENKVHADGKNNSKNYGIVYSNDNISKGTVLGSGYGVKNYKIPKIKRALEVIEGDNKTTDSDIEEENKLSDKLRSQDDNKNSKNDSGESNENKAEFIEKKCDAQKSEENLGEKSDKLSSKKSKTGLKNAANNKKSVTDDKELEKEELQKNSGNLLGNLDGKRELRSSRKKMSELPKLLEISLSRRTRKSKKSLTQESNSMKDELMLCSVTSDSENSNAREISSQEIPIISKKETQNKELQSQNTSKQDAKNSGADSKLSEDMQNYDSTDIKLNLPIQSGETKTNLKQETKAKQTELESDKITLEENFENKSEKTDKNVTNDLESSFGIDDLEMFSENVPVIDNINALIEDLENDLDSPKNTPSKSHFTKELNLETMLENITSPIKAANKGELNNSSNPEAEKDIFISEDLNSTETALLTKENCSAAANDSIVIISNKEGIKDAKNSVSFSIIDNKDQQVEQNQTQDPNYQATSDVMESQCKNIASNLEDTYSNEAIVSTTDDGKKSPSEIFRNLNENEVAKNITSSIPDSTMHTNVNIENIDNKSYVPDSTNESRCEMNSDITSTDIDAAIKHPTEQSSQTGKTTQIESIGTLLTLFKDKSKIKELLTLLGDQTSENEKIKKKLEKLSEVFFDDDASPENVIIDPASTTCLSRNNQSPMRRSSDLHSTQNDSNLAEVDCTDKDIKTQNDVNAEVANVIELQKENKNLNIHNSNVNDPLPTDIGVDVEREIDCSKTSKECLDTKEEANVCMDAGKNINNKKGTTKGVSRKGKRQKPKNRRASLEGRRITRSDAANLQRIPEIDKPVTKKPCRELQKLQEDIREMFLKDDIHSATGIRMCRLAKLVDEKTTSNQASNNESTSQEPVVLLKKCNEKTPEKESVTEKVAKKKIKKNKTKNFNVNKGSISESPSKTSENNDSVDPYDFDTDAVQNNASETKNESSSESEHESLVSTSSEMLADIKKKVKRRRGRGWQSGIIKTKNKKKKASQKSIAPPLSDNISEPKEIQYPDFTCFTDKTYCFRKNIFSYNCRLCFYSGTDIVYHYKKEHPHTEVAISRMSPIEAQEAIKESEDVNFQAISKIPSKSYTCRFCFKEFNEKKKPSLETFFWHIVSMHTGEYKQICSKCVNTQSCPFDIDIPPPPKDKRGQLLGYVCEKCNYTQISLENLKTHVIVWHNDEQTAVYTINLASLTKHTIRNLKSVRDNVDSEKPRLLRSSRSNQSMAELSDGESDTNSEINDSSTDGHIKADSINESVIENSNRIGHIQSKIAFESDNTVELNNFESSDSKIKDEPSDEVNVEQSTHPTLEKEENKSNVAETLSPEKVGESMASNDVLDYPHFKIRYTESGPKEYVCCINGEENHYKTTLLISLKKHVQLKHHEKWDGYCFLCKVIVTPQGIHLFKDCLQHFLDIHIDNLPIIEEVTPEKVLDNSVNTTTLPESHTTENIHNKSYINVRPLAELISCKSKPTEDSNSVFPVIESVVSLGVHTEQPHPSPSYPNPVKEPEVLKQYKYEEIQAHIMSRKHRVVLEAMMTQVKLVQVYKCAGRFCSFTTDSAEDALLHASTHMRVGGVDSLNCAYCDFDSSGNAIDLITHVFKCHGCCPFVCGMCFYRAAASQLVNAHIKRVHENMHNVQILRTPFKTASIQEDNVLPREEAVPHYQCCADRNTDVPCKFKTYTPGKFCEHIQTRHSNASEHSCFVCSTVLPSVNELIRHLKIHGLKLYQCTWCVYGADNETELLAHASALHPAKQPKAYLRIITNKEGTSEFRVLPLAHLNKSDIPAIEIAPKSINVFPEREAERSIELEKLIGHTNLMIETMMTSDSNTKELSNELKATPKSDEPLLSNVKLLVPTESQPETMSTPPRVQELLQTDCDLTPIIKTESVEQTPDKIPQNSLEIVCLDSDDEIPSEGVTNKVDSVSSNPNLQKIAPSEAKKFPRAELFMCEKCKIVSPNGTAFKRHINTCFTASSGLIPCGHCSMKLTKASICTHYTIFHYDKSDLPHVCKICSMKFKTLPQLKEHQMNNHKHELQSYANFIQNVGSKGKRKRGLEANEKTIEPPEKLKRYGPQDIDKLPINPILDDSVFCSLCEFGTKVRLNMVRHLQLHNQQQPVPQTAPVNPVPHLETNEKHFDKMVNLASSSIGTKAQEKGNKPDNNSTAACSVPPEALSRYPKYVPDKQRLTCGARGCSYISVDETMLKCHWETLHSGSNDFHCVHCPSYQYLDTSMPLTASRIIAHLKMHDEKLYACSLCTYYHFRRQILEKHLSDVHKGGQVMIVREGKPSESNMPSANSGTNQVVTPAPTMDLKPWQCGLCKFKSLLRPEVASHCAKIHNSKMQYKCAYCAFRTSNSENITKHQANCHSDKKEEIFYYYYREGSVMDDPDGTPLWQKQSQNTSIAETKVKTEDPSNTPSSPQPSVPPKPVIANVDLNIVKKEKEIDFTPETIEDLCKEYGDFCEPNGLKYKCSLCKIFIEDNLEAMQSHLYEELKYRKWGCSICTYKAFHNEGLNEHMQTEHRQNKEPIALPIDGRIETWVTKLLEHQKALIEKYKENLAKQKVEILRSIPGPSTSKSEPKQATETNLITSPTSNIKKYDAPELEKIFGQFGAPSNSEFCCPKCNLLFTDETIMQYHLESELNKIRWICSKCSATFQTYHEAQFHCKSIHGPQGSRPVEVIKDHLVRSAWVENVIQKQKACLKPAEELPSNVDQVSEKAIDCSESPENSLLVVRYGEIVPMPEEEIVRNKTPLPQMDSDEDKLVIDVPPDTKKSKSSRTCPYCPYVASTDRLLRMHILKHYGLKLYTCPYCGLNGSKKSIREHQTSNHPGEAKLCVETTVPKESLQEYWKKTLTDSNDLSKYVCLVCREYFTVLESLSHIHEGNTVHFGKKGEVVVKCCLCSSLHKDFKNYSAHHKKSHTGVGVDYVYSKLTPNCLDPKGMFFACSMCSEKFPELNKLKTHADIKHNSVLKYTLVPKFTIPTINLDDEDDEDEPKRKTNDETLLPPCKRVAKKSTTKLPNSRTCAKKSTTKLPISAPNEIEEYSYYGTKPSNEDSDVGIVTMMPFCNKILPFTVKKLKEIIDINPVVRVEKMTVTPESSVIDLS